MAERRMFAKRIIDSDLFLEMPLSTQALYFHLSMRGDDDGFINNPKRIMRMIGCADDDMRILIEKKFIIPFESGIVVIKHWKIHNYIRSDRYKPSECEEKKLVALDENMVYQMDTNGIPHGIPAVSIGKDRLGKDSIDNICAENPHEHSDLSSDFEKIWTAFPVSRRREKSKCFEKFRKAVKNGVSSQLIIDKAGQYVSWAVNEYKSENYIKLTSTWFNQQGWNEEYIQSGTEIQTTEKCIQGVDYL